MSVREQSELSALSPRPELLSASRRLGITKNGHISGVDDEHAKKIKKEFGQRLRAIRRRKGLSQETLALTCGLDRAYFGGIERGEHNISLVTLCKIARALKLKPAALLPFLRGGGS